MQSSRYACSLASLFTCRGSSLVYLRMPSAQTSHLRSCATKRTPNRLHADMSPHLYRHAAWMADAFLVLEWRILIAAALEQHLHTPAAIGVEQLGLVCPLHAPNQDCSCSTCQTVNRPFSIAVASWSFCMRLVCSDCNAFTQLKRPAHSRRQPWGPLIIFHA